MRSGKPSRIPKMSEMNLTLKTKSGRAIKIKKEPTDPRCMRASVGGTKKEGYYLVYRGDNLKEIEEMLTETLEAFKRARKGS